MQPHQRLLPRRGPSASSPTRLDKCGRHISMHPGSDLLHAGCGVQQQAFHSPKSPHASFLIFAATWCRVAAALCLVPCSRCDRVDARQPHINSLRRAARSASRCGHLGAMTLGDSRQRFSMLCVRTISTQAQSSHRRILPTSDPSHPAVLPQGQPHAPHRVYACARPVVWPCPTSNAARCWREMAVFLAVSSPVATPALTILG